MRSAALQSFAEPVRARPFLKWAGGKTQLLPEILARVPDRFARYHEPFIGGGAVFFALAPQQALLADINPDLVGCYRAIRDRLPAVLRYLRSHDVTEDHFYEVRSWDHADLDPAEAAARLVFLNRTCFNGLYRVNRSGRFNVPFGRYKNPRICDEDNLRAVSEALQGVDLTVGSVFETARRARRGDLVYFDPPYDPVSSTASFTSYAKDGFGREEQIRLAELFRELARRGVHVVLSNSDTPFIRELYADFVIDRVMARRAINSRATRRGPVGEVLITVPRRLTLKR